MNLKFHFLALFAAVALGKRGREKMEEMDDGMKTAMQAIKERCDEAGVEKDKDACNAATEAYCETADADQDLCTMFNQMMEKMSEKMAKREEMKAKKEAMKAFKDAMKELCEEKGMTE